MIKLLTLFAIFQLNDERNTVELFESTVYGCWGFTMLLFSSEMRNMFGNRFEEIDDEINELDKYRFKYRLVFVAHKNTANVANMYVY